MPTPSGYHWQDGWYFERITDPNPERFGWVRIRHIPKVEEAPDVDIEIEPGSWASIVASVSVMGEIGHTFELAKALHGVLDNMR